MYISIRLDELKGCNGQLIQINSTVGIDISVDENIDIEKARTFKRELEVFINGKLNGIIEQAEEKKEDENGVESKEKVEENEKGLKEEVEGEEKNDWVEVKEQPEEKVKEISFGESCKRDFISKLKETLERNPEHPEREMMKGLIDDYENGDW